MVKKLWDKGFDIDKEIEKFTVGNDFILDKKLVKFDCVASIAHAKMIHKLDIINKEELDKLILGLNEIKSLGEKFIINLEDEDCHTAIENYLVNKFGDVGKKIHSLRSRNDQVLTAMRLYEISELKEIKKLVETFINALEVFVKNNRNISIPGYTHMQKAMPSSIGLWLGCFIESSKDNLKIIGNTIDLIDKSPLGSAAGYGVPIFDIDKKFTSKEIGFKSYFNNPIYAMMSRGKFESEIIHLITMLMFDLNKLSTDLMMFSMSEFDYVSLPDKFCTGSSIMPQKKNPDVLELIRAKYHVVLGEEFKVKGIISNLMSGYNRDLQLTKEPVMNSIDIVKSCFKIMTEVIKNLKVNKETCEAAMTKELFATEKAYKLVKKGVPFRDAYKTVGKEFN